MVDINGAIERMNGLVAEWQPVAELVAKHLPASIEWIGGDLMVLRIAGEGEWIWLGVSDEENAGGPWLEERDDPERPILWAGGVRYGGDDGGMGTELIMALIPEPRDDQAIADTFVKVARQLATLPMDYL